MGTWGLSTIHYSLLTIHSAQRRGISLMEVLASTFVIGVGLLGVLAVIPFGAYQVSKTNHADYCANMLKNAESEIKIRGMAKPETWSTASAPSTLNSNGNVSVVNTTMGGKCFNCQRFIMVDPFDMGNDDINNDNVHLYKIGRNLVNQETWRQAMYGQDDLLYTITEEAARPVLTTAGNVNTVSSGKYSWFFTLLPPVNQPVPSGDIATVSGTQMIGDSAMRSEVSVDLLGCYNYVPGEEQVVDVLYSSTDYIEYASAAQLTLEANTEAELDLSKTKYIFVTWTFTPAGGSDPQYVVPVDGVWCKVLNSSTATPGGGGVRKTVFVDRKVFVANNVPDDDPTNNIASPKALIVPGVLYHTRVDHVPFQ